MGMVTRMLAATAFTAAVLAAAPASATYTVIGDTTGGPTFNRPLTGTPPTALSAVGTAVRYNTFLFAVPTAGSYNFLLTSNTTGFDTFLGLYAGDFDAASPLTNAVIYNDDLGSTATSGFTRALTAGVIYTAVITGFDNADFGAYTLTINPVAGAIPEPASWALMIGGAGMVGGALRRRRDVKVKVSFA